MSHTTQKETNTTKRESSKVLHQTTLTSKHITHSSGRLNRVCNTTICTNRAASLCLTLLLLVSVGPVILSLYRYDRTATLRDRVEDVLVHECKSCSVNEQSFWVEFEKDDSNAIQLYSRPCEDVNFHRQATQHTHKLKNTTNVYRYGLYENYLQQGSEVTIELEIQYNNSGIQRHTQHDCDAKLHLFQDRTFYDHYLNTGTMQGITESHCLQNRYESSILFYTSTLVAHNADKFYLALGLSEHIQVTSIWFNTITLNNLSQILNKQAPIDTCTIHPFSNTHTKCTLAYGGHSNVCVFGRILCRNQDNTNSFICIKFRTRRLEMLVKLVYLGFFIAVLSTICFHFVAFICLNNNY